VDCPASLSFALDVDDALLPGSCPARDARRQAEGVIARKQDGKAVYLSLNLAAGCHVEASFGDHLADAVCEPSGPAGSGCSRIEHVLLGNFTAIVLPGNGARLSAHVLYQSQPRGQPDPGDLRAGFRSGATPHGAGAEWKQAAALDTPSMKPE
jgi:hypothetical protein